MGLADIITSGLKAIDSITGGDAGLQVEVLHYPWVAQDAFGGSSFDTPFGEPIPRQVLHFQKQRWRQTSGGQMVLTFASIIIPRPIDPIGAPGRREPIDPRDRFVFPDGSFGPIVDVDLSLTNKVTGRPFFAEVWFGGQVGSARR